MVLYDEDEIKEKQQKRIRAFFFIFLLSGVLMGGILLYEEFKPLPQTRACEKAGFEAGGFLYGLEVCYDDCKGNTLNTCSYRGVPQ